MPITPRVPSEDWHRTPAHGSSPFRMSGEIEVEVSDGKKHAIHAGDIVFLEDLQGKGHVTRILIARHQCLHPRGRRLRCR